MASGGGAGSKRSYASTGAAGINEDARKSIRMEKTNYNSYIAVNKYDNGETVTTRTSSKEKKKKGGISYSMLQDLFAPRFQYKRLGYGNNWFQRDWEAWQMGQERGGTCRVLSCNNGNQWYGEFIGLPMYNPGYQASAIPTMSVGGISQDLFTGNVDEFIRKSADIRNETLASYKQQPTDVTIMDTSTLDAGLSTTVITLKRLYNQNFAYEGGYQEHIFENVCAGACTITLWECVPRECMPAASYYSDVSAPGSVNTRYPNTIAALIKKSNAMNAPLANTLRPVYGPNATSNAPESTNNEYDPEFGINKNSTLVHVNWFVKKPIKVRLKPGDRYIHKMEFPAFEIDSTAFTQLITRESTGSQGKSEVLPFFIPRFSKNLVVTIQADIKWNGEGNFRTAKTAYDAQDTVAAYNAGTKVYNINDFVNGTVNVGIGEVRVTHLCNEMHSMRMLPAQSDKNMFVDDLRSKGTGNDYDINPETNEEHTFGSTTSAALDIGLAPQV